ncbi:MAG: OB-fold nucleic acid binding domain protein [bacterium ADurb.Bin400]|nr:MAG: OB-fold nucleic acid binding domain protein [bacterium ADurb.Bin400]
MIFYRYTTNVALNDNGDQARLIDPGGKVVSMLSYEKARRAESYSLVDNTWQWTIASTPGHENLLIRNIGAFGALDSTVVSTIQAGKQMGDGAIITIAGEVSAPPRSLSARYFYVQDDSAAIQVYCHSCILPELIPGTVIQATGKLSGDTSERRLIIAGTENIYVLNYTEAPKPKKVDIVAIGEITESQYVIIRGKVTNTSGDTFYVSDGTSQARILVRNRSVVNKPTLRKGYEVEVAGIVSQYRGEFRILPFSRGHVKIIHRTGQKQQNRLPNSGSSGLISLALTTLIWNILQLAKRQLTKLPKRC